MNQCVLILLIYIVGIFSVNAKSFTNHFPIVLKNHPNDPTGSEIEHTEMSAVSFCILKESNFQEEYFADGNKQGHFSNYSTNRNSKSDLVLGNISLLRSIEKDIHFQSVLLI